MSAHIHVATEDGRAAMTATVEHLERLIEEARDEQTKHDTDACDYFCHCDYYAGAQFAYETAIGLLREEWERLTDPRPPDDAL